MSQGIWSNKSGSLDLEVIQKHYPFQEGIYVLKTTFIIQIQIISLPVVSNLIVKTRWQQIPET